MQRRLGGPQVRQGGVAHLQPRDGASLLLQAMQSARPGQLHAPASEVSLLTSWCFAVTSDFHLIYL